MTRILIIKRFLLSLSISALFILSIGNLSGQDSIPIKWGNDIDIKYKNIRDADLGIIDSDEKYFYVYSNENNSSNILKFDFEQNKLVQTKPSNLIYLGKKYDPSSSNIFDLKDKKVFLTYYYDKKNDKCYVLYAEWKNGTFTTLKSIYSFEKKTYGPGIIGVAQGNNQDYMAYYDGLPEFVISSDSSQILATIESDREVRMIVFDNNIKKIWENVYSYKENKAMKNIHFSGATLSNNGDAYLVGGLFAGVFNQVDPNFYVIKCNKGGATEILVKIDANNVANNVSVSTSKIDGSILIGGLYIDKSNDDLQKGVFFAKMNPETNKVSLKYQAFSKKFLDELKSGSRSKNMLGVKNYRVRSFYEKPDGSVIFYSEYSSVETVQTGTSQTGLSTKIFYSSGSVIISATDIAGNISNITLVNKANVSANPIFTSTLFTNYDNTFGLMYNDNKKGLQLSAKNGNALIFSTFDAKGNLGKEYVGFSGKESDVMFIPLRSFQKDNKVILFCAWFGKLRFGTIDLNFLKGQK